MEFLTPTFAEAELKCQRPPVGQLPVNTTNEQAAERIVAIDEAGEDCRQRLDRVRTKIEVYREVAEQVRNTRKRKQ